jgi:glycosyltransferase involved in cell wall biosynthesis
MLEHHLFDSIPIWRQRRLRPMVLAVFSYRYDAELVPDLLENVAPMVDGWVAFDDRQATDLFSSEPQRRRLLINRAKELGATWILAIDPDERIERGGATRIRSLTGERQRIIWEFNLREMFTASTYRVDGTWGSKKQGRLFPIFDGPLCSERPLHGAWCVAPAGYSILPAGLNLYHLKMLSCNRRLARRDLYHHLDPNYLYQTAGYDYLIDENGASFEQIPLARDFFPVHQETGHLYMADITRRQKKASKARVPTSKPHSVTYKAIGRKDNTATISQLGQLRISIGKKVRRDSKLAVVVIGLRAPRSMFNAVCSLIEQDTASEIIVVNSGGGEVSDVIGEHLRSVVLVELSQPIHVGAARNIGIQVSRAPFVAFLAGDCIAAPGWVAGRTQAHMEGECAVASVVDNDKPYNPFAWAAYLMTYGRRMTGVTSGELDLYGASYDRSLFKKYGYFSEAMAIGEDSEFHSRFRPSDSICLHTSIRTIHCNPGGPISFLKDQFRRGLRGRYLADFFRVEFNAAYITLTTIRRVARPVRLSLTSLQGKERLFAIASWPVLPVGALFYWGGMIVSYLKAQTADRLFLKATKMAIFGQFVVAVNVLRRAVDLRPITARYHFALGTILKEIGEYDNGARELYWGWDIERQSIIDLYCPNRTTRSVDAKSKPLLGEIGLQVVAFSDSSEGQLAEFLKAISVQKIPLNKLDVLVVEGHDRHRDSQVMRQVHESYAHLARFISPEELLRILSIENGHRNPSCRSFVVVTSCSCVPPPDWLEVLRAYAIAYPEVEVFQGSCPPQEMRGAGFVERISHNLGLFPRTAEHGGILRFAHAGNWACNKSLLIRSGGLIHDKIGVLGVRTLMERVMKAGGSSVHAPDWQMQFRIDSTLTKLLRRFYQDGYYGAKHLVLTMDRDLAARFFSVRDLYGSTAAAWRFAIDNFNVWRFANRSFLLHAPAFLLLLLVGLARQAGWLAGLKRFTGDD